MLGKIAGLFFISFLAAAQQNHFGNSLIDVTVLGRSDALWTLTSRQSHNSYAFSPPVFEIDGTLHAAALRNVRENPKRSQIGNQIEEYRFSGSLADDPDLSIDLIYRIAFESPVVRFRYVLRCSGSRALTRFGERNRLQYLKTSFATLPRVTEIRLSEFNQIVHSYTASERVVSDGSFSDGLQTIGPIVIGEDLAGNTLLIACEHG